MRQDGVEFGVVARFERVDLEVVFDAEHLDHVLEGAVGVVVVGTPRGVRFGVEQGSLSPRGWFVGLQGRVDVGHHALYRADDIHGYVHIGGASVFVHRRRRRSRRRCRWGGGVGCSSPLGRGSGTSLVLLAALGLGLDLAAAGIGYAFPRTVYVVRSPRSPSAESPLSLSVVSSMITMAARLDVCRGSVAFPPRQFVVDILWSDPSEGNASC